MALPKLNTIEYFCTLPISGQEAKYRPFTVGEQKILLQAMEDGETKTISSTVINLVDACSSLPEGTVRDLSNTDIEYLFMQVRIKSVGETSNIVLGCDDGTLCDGQTPIEVNLEEIDIEGEVKDDTVKLTDTISVKLTVPNWNQVQDVVMDVENIASTHIFEILERSIRQVITEEDVIDRSDISSKEMKEFVNEMSTEQFGLMMEWFNGLPKLVKEVKYNCVKCNKENTVKLEGIQNFFV
tara:strand:- start:2047 stop:2766 length:720 start_codon:yes stop_codon:yes gene_type:complete